MRTHCMTTNLLQVWEFCTDIFATVFCVPQRNSELLRRLSDEPICPCKESRYRQNLTWFWRKLVSNRSKFFDWHPGPKPVFTSTVRATASITCSNFKQRAVQPSILPLTRRPRGNHVFLDTSMRCVKSDQREVIRSCTGASQIENLQ